MAIDLSQILKGIAAGAVGNIQQAAQTPAPAAAGTSAAPAAPQAAPPQVSLYDSPEYRAWVLQSQTGTQAALADAQRRQAALQSILDVQLPGQQRDQAQQQRNLASSAAARGIFHSGENLRNASQLADQQGRQNAALVSQTATGIGDLSSQLASNIANQQADQANQALKAQQNLNAASGGSW